MHTAARTGILAFGVFTNDDEINVTHFFIRERRLHTGQQLGRTITNILLEPLANRQAQTAQGNVIRHGREADRTEINRVEWFEDLEAVICHHLAVLEIIVTTVWEILVFNFVLSGQLTGDIQRLHPLRSDFFSDPVCWND